MVASISVLYGMEMEKAKHNNLSECKEIYLKWHQDSILGTEERWECLKNAIETKEIEFKPIVKDTKTVGFLAYAAPVEVLLLDMKTKNSILKKAIFMYPSPRCMDSSFLAEIDKAYSVSVKNDKDLLITGWKQELLDPSQFFQLLSMVRPKEAIFPGWQDSEKFSTYSYTKAPSKASKGSQLETPNLLTK
jgi:hypothetical protein